jgi:hypothetical protein
VPIVNRYTPFGVILPRKTERGEAAELENVGWVVVRDAQRPPELLGLP